MNWHRLALANLRFIWKPRPGAPSAVLQSWPALCHVLLCLRAILNPQSSCSISWLQLRKDPKITECWIIYPVQGVYHLLNRCHQEKFLIKLLLWDQIGFTCFVGRLTLRRGRGYKDFHYYLIFNLGQFHFLISWLNFYYFFLQRLEQAMVRGSTLRQ